MKSIPLILIFYISLISNLIAQITGAGIFTNLVPVQLATGMQFTEGPVWHPAGYLVFSDVNANIIYKWSEAKGVEIVSKQAGNSNGIACTKKDDFVLCRQGTRDIAKMDVNGVITSYLSSYIGKKLNSPNDCELSYMGSIYFTDPDYGVNAADRELKYQGVFCIPYNQTKAVLLDSTLVKPNGLTFSIDWRTLYVCESSTNTIYSYSLINESTIQDLTKDKKVFVKVLGTGEIDGITSDVFGNLYVAFGDGGIKIFNKDAVEVGQITFPATVEVRNLCFGGKYFNQLFVTAGTSIYKIDVRFYGDFVAPGLLGVPSDKSVVFSAISDKNLDAYISYGANPANLNLRTLEQNFPANSPLKITIDNLTANTPYTYQLMYRLQGEINFVPATKGSFFTQRAAGAGFSFAVEADPHLDDGSNYVTFRNMLQNALNLKPDFLIDLGDNFMVEKYPLINRYYMEQRCFLYRKFWDNVCHSMPLFIVQGNHDAEPRTRWILYRK